MRLPPVGQRERYDARHHAGPLRPPGSRRRSPPSAPRPCRHRRARPPRRSRPRRGRQADGAAHLPGGGEQTRGQARPLGPEAGRRGHRQRQPGGTEAGHGEGQRHEHVDGVAALDVDSAPARTARPPRAGCPAGSCGAGRARRSSGTPRARRARCPMAPGVSASPASSGSMPSTRCRYSARKNIVAGNAPPTRAARPLATADRPDAEHVQRDDRLRRPPLDDDEEDGRRRRQPEAAPALARTRSRAPPPGSRQRRGPRCRR